MTALERQAVTEYKARRYTGGIHPQRLYHLTHGHIQSVLAKGSRIAAIRETYGQIQRERIRAMHGRLATTHRRLGGLLKEADEDPSGDAMNGYNRVLPYLTVAGSMRKDELDTLLQDTYIVSAHQKIALGSPQYPHRHPSHVKLGALALRGRCRGEPM